MNDMKCIESDCGWIGDWNDLYTAKNGDKKCPECRGHATDYSGGCNYNEDPFSYGVHDDREC